MDTPAAPAIAKGTRHRGSEPVQPMTKIEAAMARAHEDISTLHATLGALEDRLQPVLGVGDCTEASVGPDLDTSGSVIHVQLSELDMSTRQAIERVETLLARLEL